MNKAMNVINTETRVRQKCCIGQLVNSTQMFSNKRPQIFHFISLVISDEKILNFKDVTTDVGKSINFVTVNQIFTQTI